MATKLSHENSRVPGHRQLCEPIGEVQHRANLLGNRGCLMAVYGVFQRRLDGRGKPVCVFMSYSELSSETDYDMRSVIRAVGELVRQGVIQKVKHHKYVDGQRVCLVNSYSIVPPSKARMREDYRVRGDRWEQKLARDRRDAQRLQGARDRARQRKLSRAAAERLKSGGGTDTSVRVEPNIDLFSLDGVAPSLETVLYNGQMWHRDALKRCLEVQRRR